MYMRAAFCPARNNLSLVLVPHEILYRDEKGFYFRGAHQGQCVSSIYYIHPEAPSRSRSLMVFAPLSPQG